MTPLSNSLKRFKQPAHRFSKELVKPIAGNRLTVGRANLANKLWRLTNLYYIRTKKKELIKFRLNGIQLAMLHALPTKPPIRDFYLKYRQGGVSTFWLLWWLDDTIFTPNTVTGILADKWENLARLWEIIEIAYANMPDYVKPRLGEESSKKLKFADINSEIFISLSVRSTAVHNLHISEWCFTEDEELNATLGSVSPVSNITGESTANGVGNHGYETYQDAKKGLNGYGAHFFPWFIDPDYHVPLNGMNVRRTDEEKLFAQKALKDFGVTVSDGQILWRRRMKRSLREMFKQEYPEDDETAFLASGDRFFDSRKVLTLLNEARAWSDEHEPWQRTDNYIAWEKPEKDCLYVAGADVAEGVEGDYSVLSVLNVTRRRQAFVYRARVAIDVFYRECYKWGMTYGKALLAVERNNHGHAVLQGLNETLNYPNLYMEKTDTRETIDKFPKVKLGWGTTLVTKPLMLDHLKIAIEGDTAEDETNFQPEFLVRDQMFLQECLTFVNNNGKLEAESGKHDDTVIAWAICLQMYQKARSWPSRASEFGILIGGDRALR